MALPWRALQGFALALLAQLSLEPSQNRGWQLGLVLYLLGAGSLAWAYLRGELQVSAYLPSATDAPRGMQIRIPAVILSCALALLAPCLTRAQNQDSNSIESLKRELDELRQRTQQLERKLGELESARTAARLD